MYVCEGEDGCTDAVCVREALPACCVVLFAELCQHALPGAVRCCCLLFLCPRQGSHACLYCRGMIAAHLLCATHLAAAQHTTNSKKKPGCVHTTSSITWLPELLGWLILAAASPHPRCMITCICRMKVVRPFEHNLQLKEPQTSKTGCPKCQNGQSRCSTEQQPDYRTAMRHPMYVVQQHKQLAALYVWPA